MKITKKDKIVLMALFSVLIIGVFIMYGIIPANKELEEAEKKYNDLKSEVDALNMEYIGNDPARLERELEKTLMNYYLDEESNVVMAKNIEEAYYNADNGFFRVVEEIENQLGDGASFKAPEMSPSMVRTESTVVSSDFISKKSVSYMIGKAEFTFNYENVDGFKALLQKLTGKIDVVNQKSGTVSSQSYQYRNIVLNQSPDLDSVSGTMEITKLYAKTPENVPAPLVKDPSNFKLKDLADAPKKPIVDKEERTLTFKTIDYADYYEIYEIKSENGVITLDEKGNPTYKLVRTSKKIEAKEDENVVVFNYGSTLKEDKFYVLAAVGNYQTAKEGKLYYRTIMSKYLVNNKFTINQ